MKCPWPSCENEFEDDGPDDRLCETCQRRIEEALATGARAQAMLDAFQRSLDAPFTTPIPKRGKSN